MLPLAIAQPPTEVPGGLAVASVLALGIFGTAFAFVVYYRLIGEIGFGRASVVAFTIPPVSLVYGSLLLDEPITAATIGGMALILVGVHLIARGRRRAAPVPAVSLSDA